MLKNSYLKHLPIILFHGNMPMDIRYSDILTDLVWVNWSTVTSFRGKDLRYPSHLPSPPDSDCVYLFINIPPPQFLSPDITFVFVLEYP